MGMSVLFTGDLSFCGVFRRQFEAGAAIFSQDLIDAIQSGDHTVCNLEGAATNRPHSVRPDADTVTPPESLTYLKACGIDIYNLGNNHVFDSGVEGFQDTISAIWQVGGQVFGAGMNLDEASEILYLQQDDVTVALIGICFRENRYIAEKGQPGVFWEGHQSQLERRIVQARQSADWVVLNYHGREEYTRVPLPYRRRQLQGYLHRGVDLVVAHHPHVAQGIEKIGPKTIFYSLGNFAFDVPALDGCRYTDVSFVPRIQFERKTYDVQLIPTVMDRNQGIVGLGDEAFLADIERLSDFKHLGRKWREEAYRVVVTEGRQGTSLWQSRETASGQACPCGRMSRFRYLAGRMRSIVGSRYRRHMYGSALLSMLLRRVRNVS